MILTNKFLNTFDTVFDVLNKAEFYGSNMSADKEITNLEMALPGFSKKDIDVKVEGRTLIISADVKEEDVTKYIKSFKHSYILPINADTENMSATMLNGLLTIDFGNKSEAKSINIK
jgi:HSP20 family molecular chaperone IbpA